MDKRCSMLKSAAPFLTPLSTSSSHMKSDTAAFPQKPATLISLPDNIIHILFDELSSVPGKTAKKSEDAYSFAITCRRLYDCYRITYAAVLDMSNKKSVSLEGVLQILERFPNVHTICLAGSQWGERALERSPDGLGQEEHSVENHALGIKSLNLTGMTFARDDEGPGFMRKVVKTFPNLEHLNLGHVGCVGDEWLAAIAEFLSKSLSSLDLMSMHCPVSDAGGAQLGNLFNLKALSLPFFSDLTDITFSSLGALKDLEELNLYNCSISDTVACSILPNFRELRLLSLGACKNITSAVFQALPRSLVELNVNESGALDANLLPSALVGMSHLTKFEGCHCSAVSDISFLAPVAPRLEELRLSRIRASDANIASLVSRMVNLEHLDLSWSSVSDETAEAISDLEKIRHVDLSSTLLSNDGLKAMIRGTACQTLRYLRLGNCPHVRDVDGSMEALRDTFFKCGCGAFIVDGWNLFVQ